MSEYFDLSFFPKIMKYSNNPDTFKEYSVYIGAAGFEDRCLRVLKNFQDARKQISYVIGIKYLPKQMNNLEGDFKEIGDKISTNAFKWLEYDRFNPENFYEEFKIILEFFSTKHNILIDISGMSKFLIIILLEAFEKFPNNITIIYCEAEIYHPTIDEFSDGKKQIPDNLPPSFLTTDIFKIVTTSKLSNQTMQGYPYLIIAFPTFNYKEIFTLLNTISPKYLVIIEGIPHYTPNEWRMNAIRDINKSISKDFEPTLEDKICCYKASTFEYIETIRVLLECYSKFKYQYKCIIAPTGSKLQAVGTFFFKMIYPEINFVYPVTKGFSEIYTTGCENIWYIQIPKYSEFIDILKSMRNLRLKRMHDEYLSD